MKRKITFMFVVVTCLMSVLFGCTSPKEKVEKQFSSYEEMIQFGKSGGFSAVYNLDFQTEKKTMISDNSEFIKGFFEKLGSMETAEIPESEELDGGIEYLLSFETDSEAVTIGVGQDLLTSAFGQRKPTKGNACYQYIKKGTAE